MSDKYIIIHGKPIRLIYVQPNEFDNTQYGMSNTRKDEIYLSKEGGKDSKIQTIIHEYLHFFEADFHESFDEELIQKLAMSIYWFLTSNGVDLDKLLGSTKNDPKRI